VRCHLEKKDKHSTPVIRAKVSEVLVTMSPCRATVSDASSKTVASLSTDVNGTVTAIIANGIHGKVDGRDNMGKGVKNA
jgi:hypothetical protein